MTPTRLPASSRSKATWPAAWPSPLSTSAARGWTAPASSEGLRSADGVDLDGFRLRFGADDNQGSDAVFLTVIGNDGRFYPVETLVDAMTP